jgi:hypothetical protein
VVSFPLAFLPITYTRSKHKLIHNETKRNFSFADDTGPPYRLWHVHICMRQMPSAMFPFQRRVHHMNCTASFGTYATAVVAKGPSLHLPPNQVRNSLRLEAVSLTVIRFRNHTPVLTCIL